MHAEAWTLTSEYRDRPEWNQCFLKECTVLDSHSIPLNLNHLLLDNNNTNLTQLQQQQQSYAQPKKLHFEDYLIKVSMILSMIQSQFYSKCIHHNLTKN